MNALQFKILTYIDHVEIWEESQDANGLWCVDSILDFNPGVTISEAFAFAMNVHAQDNWIPASFDH